MRAAFASLRCDDDEDDSFVAIERSLASVGREVLEWHGERARLLARVHSMGKTIERYRADVEKLKAENKELSKKMLKRPARKAKAKP